MQNNEFSHTIEIDEVEMDVVNENTKILQSEDFVEEIEFGKIPDFPEEDDQEEDPDYEDCEESDDILDEDEEDEECEEILDEELSDLLNDSKTPEIHEELPELVDSVVIDICENENDDTDMKENLIQESFVKRQFLSKRWLGDETYQSLVMWNFVLYQLSFWGLLVCFEAYKTKPLYDYQENMLCLIVNATTVLILIMCFVLKTNKKENALLVLKMIHYIGLPIFMYVQIDSIFFSVQNFTELFHNISETIHTILFFTLESGRYWSYFMIAIGIISFLSLVIMGSIYSILIPVCTLVTKIIILCAVFCIMIVIPFSFYTYLFVCYFVYTPYCVIYDCILYFKGK